MCGSRDKPGFKTMRRLSAMVLMGVLHVWAEALSSRCSGIPDVWGRRVGGQECGLLMLVRYKLLGGKGASKGFEVFDKAS